MSNDATPSRGGQRAFVGVSLKLYLGHAETLQWCETVRAMAERRSEITDGRVELVVLPALTAIAPVAGILTPAGIALGAQNLWAEDRGPFTGEVSGADLAALGCQYAEIGHAERRRLFGETDDLVRRKVAAARRSGLVPLLCVGEEEPGSECAAAARCIDQLAAALDDHSVAPPGAGLVVAYEPVWAIGAPAPAPPDHIRAVCSSIRQWLAEHPEGAGGRVVYGGSAGEGLVSRIADSVDGLFLGRFAHDPLRLARVLDEVAVL